MTTTIEMSKKIHGTKFSDFAPEVVAYSKVLALTSIGTMIAGAARPDGQIVTGYVKRMGGNPEATALGTGFKTSVETAAFANGNFAHSAEFEDVSFPEAVSTNTIYAVVLALGEKLKSSGPEIIEAFVIGQEVQSRTALSCLEGRRRGILAISWAGTIGCAAAAAKLLKLDVDRTTMALSIAASQASGIARQQGTHMHYFEMGMPGRNGATAALLASGGYTGKSDIFEGKLGFLEIITGGKIPSTDDVLGKWGAPFRVMEVGIKRYPCCFLLARIIDAVSDLKREHKLTAEKIEEVSVDVNLSFPTSIQYPEPKDEAQVQFSLHHAVAAVILEDELRLSSFQREKIDDEAFKALRKKVTMHPREDWGWGMVSKPIVTVILKNGEKLTKEADNAKGQPPDLLSFDEAIYKYRRCTEPRLQEAKVAKSIEMMRGLENCKDVSEIVRAVSP